METSNIELITSENLQVLEFIKNWQSKNEYNPKFLNEHNAKFNAEFEEFLNNSNLSEETKKTFK